MPDDAIPHLNWPLPALARRSYRLAATVLAGPSLELTVRCQERRYSAQIYDPGTGQRWRCPHRHFSQASAGQCAGVMARRIHRLGWRRATERQRSTRRARNRRQAVPGSI